MEVWVLAWPDTWLGWELDGKMPPKAECLKLEKSCFASISIIVKNVLCVFNILVSYYNNPLTFIPFSSIRWWKWLGHNIKFIDCFSDLAHFLHSNILQLSADWCSNCSASFRPTYVYITVHQAASVWMEIRFSKEMYASRPETASGLSPKCCKFLTTPLYTHNSFSIGSGN